jgi:hypothetical protein
MRIVDELVKAASPSVMTGRKVEKPDRALVVGGRCEGPATDEPARPSVVFGVVESHCIPAVDREPSEASWEDLPPTFARDGLYGGPR